MKHLKQVSGFVGLLFICIMITDCGRATRSGQETGSKVYNLGKASEFDIYNTIPRLLRKYQFNVLHDYNTGAYQTIETEWKMRYPLEDEEEVGIVDGKIRLFFRMRKTMDQLYYVRMEAQNMVRTSDSGGWFNSAMSNMMKQRIDKMADELEREFEEGRLIH